MVGRNSQVKIQFGDSNYNFRALRTIVFVCVIKNLLFIKEMKYNDKIMDLWGESKIRIKLCFFI